MMVIQPVTATNATTTTNQWLGRGGLVENPVVDLFVQRLCDGVGLRWRVQDAVHHDLKQGHPLGSKPQFYGQEL